MSLASIEKSVKLARECALTGSYDEALVYYTGVVAEINSYLKTPSLSPDLISNWTAVREALREETTAVQAITNELAAFKENPRLASGLEQDKEPRNSSPSRKSPSPGRAKDPLIWDPPSPRSNSPIGRNLWGQQQLGTARQSGLSRGVPKPPSHMVGGGFNFGRQPKSHDPDYSSLDNDEWGGAPKAPPRQRGPVKPPVPRFSGGARGGGTPRTASSKDDPRAKEKKGHDDMPAERPKFRDGEPELIEVLEREILDVKQSVPWNSIAGLREAKGLLKEAVMLPIRFPKFFSGLRRPWKGILMYGPPGTGKTMLAKAVATECSSTFFNCPISALGSKWRGETEKLVRILFRMARYYAPSTIFFDEIDAIGTSRESDGGNDASRRMKAELLTQMDGMDSNLPTPSSSSSSSSGDGAGDDKGDAPAEERKTVVVIAATNFPWDLDEALKRRLEKRIYIPLPDAEARRDLMKINLKGLRIDEGLDLDEFADRMAGYSGADITNVCRDASMMGMRKKLKEMNDMDLSKMNEDEFDTPITKEDFEDALAKVSPSVSQKDIERFEKWRAEFGSE
ncbi:p97H [Monocercomonoides exilis]|uniref:p97H n=1 Tax=Monocercomonoides exilis TaxID=2049356 RepID=UPI00355A8063|nr:p97H [Monocercomonoides exilis]|eukprot:MONOS_5338.1-p1 / transcript=MONOS_5338.1 / gene=MONOS_5338 / organism=Monocercomonoides_exilis_PA203 / gene_product= p97H / transcript_product= p97H / location=Mono_scaffold00154:25940-27696(+) / protein_length=567 / sequence_SO=supercontig / SO=protein_coding / is_pseudo=false